MNIVDFEYDGRKLSSYDCMICHLTQNDGGLTAIEAGSNLTFNTVRNNNSFRHYKTSSEFEEVVQITFEIARRGCGAWENKLTFDLQEIRQFTTWLNRREYHKLKFIDTELNSMFHGLYYYGSFNVKPVMFDGNCYGFNLTFTSDAPYAWGESIKKQAALEKDDSFIVVDTSDDYGILYPEVTIKTYSAGTLILTNELDPEHPTQIKNVAIGEVIKFDGEHQIITATRYVTTQKEVVDEDGNTSTVDVVEEVEHPRLYNDFNYNFPKMLKSKTSTTVTSGNKYSTNMKVDLTLTYTPVRKAGVI